MEDNLGNMIAEFCYTQGRAVARLLISLFLVLIFVVIGILLVAWGVEDIDEYMLYTGILMFAIAIGFLIWGLRARSSRTQIFENGITHARGSKIRTITFESIKGMATVSNDGWATALIGGGLIGALLFGSGSKSLRLHAVHGPAVDIKGRHVHKFKRATRAVEEAYEQFVLRNLTQENVSSITIMLTEKLELANGALTTSTGLMRSNHIVLPLADIVKVDNERARAFRFIGRDETGAEKEMFKIAASELISHPVFTRVLELAGHPVAQ